ncbi:hypothetical protein [Ilumatobacter coccineus]|uniref:Uncharacterized protein n=1 Tax=Ilumatobacter coccineus (strain NBRC 103263 / KCTC 29153 / YM16-304) TaxID=1313172 RepID=A0A6C7EIU9_ILUCY|nr:hypothetical protein [Ilumatobacter coccineus]BAN03896.1 hypothetical protein YM304_35820 [Ilumatobacter coccineus YM16-304]
MSKIDIQEQLCNVLTGLFRDPQEARQYADDPQRYLGEKMGHDADYAQVDMKHVVDYSVAQAEVAPHVADAMYQPAPTIRVPYPKEERIAEQNDGYKVDEYKADEYKADEYDGDPKIDRPVQDAHDRPPVRDDHEPPMDRDPVPPKEQPKYETEYPKEVEVEKVDEYYKATPKEGATPAEEYAPDKWTPDCEITEECVTYSISNCVTEVYKDQPEIADRLCETRDYADPYPRLCPEDDYSDLITEIKPMYEPVDADPMKDRYEEAHKDEYEDAGKDYDGTYKEVDPMDDHKQDPKYDEHDPKYDQKDEHVEKDEYVEKDQYEDADKDYDGTYREVDPMDDHKQDPKYDEHDPKYDQKDEHDQKDEYVEKDQYEDADKDYDGTYKEVDPMDDHKQDPKYDEHDPKYDQKDEYVEKDKYDQKDEYVEKDEYVDNDYGNGHQPDPVHADAAKYNEPDAHDEMKADDHYGEGDQMKVEMEPAVEMAPPAEMAYEEAQPEPMAYEAPPEEVVTYDEPAPMVEHAEVPVPVDEAPMDDMIED